MRTDKTAVGKTTLSSIFETNERFETGLKFLKSLASRPGFFSMGVTRACFNPDGTVTVDKETLTILVTRGLGHADTARLSQSSGDRVKDATFRW